MQTIILVDYIYAAFLLMENIKETLKFLLIYENLGCIINLGYCNVFWQVQ